MPQAPPPYSITTSTMQNPYGAPLPPPPAYTLPVHPGGFAANQVPPQPVNPWLVTQPKLDAYGVPEEAVYYPPRWITIEKCFENLKKTLVYALILHNRFWYLKKKEWTRFLKKKSMYQQKMSKQIYLKLFFFRCIWWIFNNKKVFFTPDT